MRDLAKDLEICNAATRGPWEKGRHHPKGSWPAHYELSQEGEMYYHAIAFSAEDGGEGKANAIFIAAAREGWPQAIERAIAAECELAEMKIAGSAKYAAYNLRLREEIVILKSGLAQKEKELSESQQRLAERWKDTENILEDRDRAEEWADKLAHAIGGEEIGEHTNLNNPWANAIEIADQLLQENAKLRKVATLAEEYMHGKPGGFERLCEALAELDGDK